MRVEIIRVLETSTHIETGSAVRFAAARIRLYP
jgi:hypothetical protein